MALAQCSGRCTCSRSHNCSMCNFLNTRASLTVRSPISSNPPPPYIHGLSFPRHAETRPFTQLPSSSQNEQPRHASKGATFSHTCSTSASLRFASLNRLSKFSPEARSKHGELYLATSRWKTKSYFPSAAGGRHVLVCRAGVTEGKCGERAFSLGMMSNMSLHATGPFTVWLWVVRGF